MNPQPLSFWDRVELLLLRLAAAFLVPVDRLFNVQWGERVLARMMLRWEERLARLDEAMAELDRERRRIQDQTQALAIHTAAVYLGGRCLTQEELLFNPADPRDDELLDASIEILVKKQLASIESREAQDGQLIYHLEPDWAAIRCHLAKASAQADPEVADCLAEGLVFIDQAFMSGSSRHPLMPEGESGPGTLDRE